MVEADHVAQLVHNRMEWAARTQRKLLRAAYTSDLRTAPALAQFDHILMFNDLIDLFHHS